MPLGNSHDGLFDLVGDMRHDLDGSAKIISTAFLRNDGVINSARRIVVFLGQRQRRVAFIVTEIQIRLGAVIRHIDFAMLIGIHRPGVDINIRIQLEEGDLQPATFHQVADRGRGQALSQ